MTSDVPFTSQDAEIVLTKIGVKYNLEDMEQPVFLRRAWRPSVSGRFL